MTRAEFIAYRTREREFLATLIGAAFHAFKNAHFALAACESRDNASTAMLLRLDDTVKKTERALREALDAQAAEVARLRVALGQIEGQAVCRGMDGVEGDGEMLRYCYEIARDALGGRA